MIKQLDKWHHAKLGYLVFALIELGLAYAFISLAIDRGNPWYYLLTFLFLFGFLQNFIKLIGKLFNDKTSRPRRN